MHSMCMTDKKLFLNGVKTNWDILNDHALVY